MPRSILTFQTLFQVLAAEKTLRDKFRVRPTTTPPGLSASICAMSVELLDPSEKEAALEHLTSENLLPSGIHDLP